MGRRGDQIEEEMEMSRLRYRKRLSEVNPEGRLDVLAYGIARKLVRKVEKEQNLPGLWDELDGYVERLVKEAVGGDRMPMVGAIGRIARRREIEEGRREAG